jgi:hypothetical protein
LRNSLAAGLLLQNNHDLRFAELCFFMSPVSYSENTLFSTLQLAYPDAKHIDGQRTSRHKKLAGTRSRLAQTHCLPLLPHGRRQTDAGNTSQLRWLARQSWFGDQQLGYILIESSKLVDRLLLLLGMHTSFELCAFFSQHLLLPRS